MDLAAMLAMSEHAAEDGVQILIFPRVPGLGGDLGLLDAFFRNVTERAPGVTTVRPRWRWRGEEPPKSFDSGLGRTLVLEGDDCIDPDLFPEIQELGLDALVWLFDPEDALQAEAALELALDASLHLAPLVVIATFTGSARGVAAHGIGAIVQLGEIMVEGGNGEELLVADVPAPAGFPERPRRLPLPAPVLQQRLAAHQTGTGHKRGRP
jgi:hypothetical protein